MSTQTKHFTRAQAYAFGHQLGLSTATINDLIAEMEATRGNEIVMQVFDEVDRQNTILRDSLLQSITSAVLNANSHYDDLQAPTQIHENRYSQLNMLGDTTLNQEIIQSSNNTREVYIIPGILSLIINYKRYE